MNLYIPKKLKIGFQNRQDTFTKKLAYVVYYDDTGKLRKEGSWQSWRDKNIQDIEIPNDPTNGFVLNKGVQRDGYWGSGRSVIRIHDPRDFEFEISVDNLLGILMHTDCNQREIQQACVYAWKGTELILLPTNSVEYQQAVEYTALQTQKVSARDLIKGATYRTKKNPTDYIYLGYFDWYDMNGYAECTQKHKGKKHVFCTTDQYQAFSHVSPSSLAICVDTTPVENYSELVDKFFDTALSQKIVGVELGDLKNWEDGIPYEARGHREFGGEIYEVRANWALYWMPELKTETHSFDPFKIKKHWKGDRYSRYPTYQSKILYAFGQAYEVPLAPTNDRAKIDFFNSLQLRQIYYKLEDGTLIKGMY